MDNCVASTKYLTDRIRDLGAFDIISSAGAIPATPLVAFKIKDTSRFDEYDFAKHLRRHGWIVPAYSLPPTGDGKPGTALRVVVREDFSRGLADWLVEDMKSLLEELNGMPSKVAMQAARQIEKMALNEQNTVQVTADSILEGIRKEGRIVEEDQKDENGRKVGKRGHVVNKHNPVC